MRASGVGVSTIFPGPISDAGMRADTGAPPPTGMRARAPAAVADAVMDAIRRNRAEVDVAPLLLRAAVPLSLLWPRVFTAIGRHADRGHAVERMVTSHRQNR